MKTNQTPFHKLAIGSTFHLGKSYGSGATRETLSWEVLQKTSKTMAKVISAHGAFRAIGGSQSLSSFTATFNA